MVYTEGFFFLFSQAFLMRMVGIIAAIFFFLMGTLRPKKYHSHMLTNVKSKQDLSGFQILAVFTILESSIKMSNTQM